jgi:hypothetical protein
MSQGHEVLEALADRIEQGGGDPARVDIVRRAQRFKRSWIELAEGLSALRKSRKYEKWGYSDLADYCSKELHIKAATLDKLVLSYGALRTHAPEVLRRDGISREIPTLEAVDYFSRAVGSGDAGGSENANDSKRRLDAPREVLDELRSAVFDEGRSVGELRKRFDPILRPKSPGDDALDNLRKLKSLAERLSGAVQTTEGLTEKRVGRVLAVMEALVRDVEELLEKQKSERDTHAA